MILLASAGGSTVPVRARLVQAASTRPTAPGKPFTRRSIRNLADHLSMNTRGASGSAGRHCCVYRLATGSLAHEDVEGVRGPGRRVRALGNPP